MTETCSICLQNISASQKLVTDCNHTFCSSCILTWANKSERNIGRRFHPIGLIAKDPIPIVACPLCRQEVRNYVSPTGKHTIKYQYQGNPYQLRIGGLVYYYQRLRQPGGKRAGSIGILKSISKNTMTIECVWPDRSQVHHVRFYCVFDIFALNLFGSIPTRSEVNQYFVADNLGQGFITENACQFAPILPLNEIEPVIQHYNANPHLISPLCKPIISLDFFLNISLRGALCDTSTPLLGLKRLPDPLNTVNLVPYFEALQTHSIGLNQARVILAYYQQGYAADEDDTPIALDILRNALPSLISTGSASS